MAGDAEAVAGDSEAIAGGAEGVAERSASGASGQPHAHGERPADQQREGPGSVAGESAGPAGPGQRAPSATLRTEPGVVIDLTDATLARNGGPVVSLGATAAPSAAATPTAVPPAATSAPAAATPAATVNPVRGSSAATSLLASLLASPLALLVTLNALNVADAALTVLWIEMGIAREANPIVDAVGFPAKVVAVAVGSYLVYRVRPRWLIVPIAALAAVVVYHILGASVVLVGAS